MEPARRVRGRRCGGRQPEKGEAAKVAALEAASLEAQSKLVEAVEAAKASLAATVGELDAALPNIALCEPSLSIRLTAAEG